MKTVQREHCDSVQDVESTSQLSSAQLRKINKPIVEKKRRERINACLDELKDLLLQTATNSKPEASHSKLEKADILEMTVRHLRNVQRSHRQAPYPTSSSMVPDCSSSISRPAPAYRDGYSDCAREVATYLGRLESVNLITRTRVLSHLSSRLRSVNSSSTQSAASRHLNILQTPQSSSSSLPFPVCDRVEQRSTAVSLSTSPYMWGMTSQLHSTSSCSTLASSHPHCTTSTDTRPSSADDIVETTILGHSEVKQELPTSSSSVFDENGNNIDADDDKSDIDHEVATHEDVWRPW